MQVIVLCVAIIMLALGCFCGGIIFGIRKTIHCCVSRGILEQELAYIEKRKPKNITEE